MNSRPTKNEIESLVVEPADCVVIGLSWCSGGDSPDKLVRDGGYKMHWLGRVVKFLPCAHKAKKRP